jgi:uncharacterized membrane protein YkoI
MSRNALLSTLALWLLGMIAAGGATVSQADDFAGADRRSPSEGILRDEQPDYDRARDLLEQGAIRPLREIVARVAASHPGELVGVSLDREHRRWIYRLRILSPTGRLSDVAVDAATGTPFGLPERR